MDMEKEIRALAASQDVLVLATCAQGRPHTSLMAYAAEEDARTFYMVTRTDSRKWSNVTANAEVSLLIDSRTTDFPHNRQGALALTVSGRAAPVTEEDTLHRAKKMLFSRHPGIETFAEGGESVVFLVRASGFLLLDGIAKARYSPA